MILTESVVEDAALDWFRKLGYDVIGGPEMPPGVGALRADYGEVVLKSVLRGVVERLNPHLPDEALDDAVRRLTRPEGATLEARNRAFHRMMVEGVTVEYRDADGAVRGAQVKAIDFDAPDANDWLAVNQFTVVENRHERRPDLVLFVNGLPLAVIELKNPADEGATILTAWRQLQTYRRSCRRFSRSTRCWRCRTACRRGSARSPRAGSGSSRGAPSAASSWRRRSTPSCRSPSRGCSRRRASSLCCATSSSSRTTEAAPS